MNRAQKAVVVVAVIAWLAAILFPPYEGGSYWKKLADAKEDRSTPAKSAAHPSPTVAPKSDSSFEEILRGALSTTTEEQWQPVPLEEIFGGRVTTVKLKPGRYFLAGEEAPPDSFRKQRQWYLEITGIPLVAGVLVFLLRTGSTLMFWRGRRGERKVLLLTAALILAALVFPPFEYAMDRIQPAGYGFIWSPPERGYFRARLDVDVLLAEVVVIALAGGIVAFALRRAPRE